jgi:hypothetical protein
MRRARVTVGRTVRELGGAIDIATAARGDDDEDATKSSSRRGGHPLFADWTLFLPHS